MKKVVKKLLMTMLLVTIFSMMGCSEAEIVSEEQHEEKQIVESSVSNEIEEIEVIISDDSDVVDITNDTTIEADASADYMDEASTETEPAKLHLDEEYCENSEWGIHPASEYDNFYDLLSARVSDNPYYTYIGGEDFFLSPAISIVDVNGDGRRDLIVSGVLGLRDKSFTDIILDLPTGFKEISFGGDATSVSDNRVLFSDSDYEGAGEIRISDEYVVEFSTSGDTKQVLEHYSETEYSYDSDEEEIVESVNKYSDLNGEISIEQFESLMAEYESKSQPIWFTTLGTSDWDDIPYLNN